MTQSANTSLRDAVSAAIRTLRAERGWTQRELCRRSELSPAYLSELEAAQKDASPDVVERLADAFGSGVDEFLWVVLLAMMHGEVPGIERRAATLKVARQALDLKPEQRRELEQFLAFQRWRDEPATTPARNKRRRGIVEDTESSDTEITED